MRHRRLLSVLLVLVVAFAAWRFHSWRTERASEAAVETIRQLRMGAKSDPTAIRKIQEFAHHSDPFIRLKAVSSGAGAALERGAPCPMFVVDALEDDNLLVREVAASHIGVFSSFSPKAFDILHRASSSPNDVVRSNSICVLRHAIHDDLTRSMALGLFRDIMESRFYPLMQRHNAMIQLWNMRADDQRVACFVLATDPADFTDGKSAEFLSDKYVEILQTISLSSPDSFSAAVANVSNAVNKNESRNCAEIVARMKEQYDVDALGR